MRGRLTIFGWFMLTWMAVALVAILVLLPRESGARLASGIMTAVIAGTIVAVVLKKALSG